MPLCAEPEQALRVTWGMGELVTQMAFVGGFPEEADHEFSSCCSEPSLERLQDSEHRRPKQVAWPPTSSMNKKTSSFK